jgi:hypothetical protein
MLFRSFRARVVVRLIAVAVIGSPSLLTAADKPSLVVDPPKLELVGPDARWTLLVDRETAGGRLVDAGETATFASSDERICRVGPTGEVLAVAVADGRATVTITVDGARALVPVHVSRSTEPRKLHFENDVTPLLTRFACNYSGCHGKAEGQNGFKLSVFGFDARADYDALTKEARGRRISLAAPDESLFLQKATGAMPHGGGARIDPESREFALLRSWIREGTPFGDADAPHVVSLALSPRERVLTTLSRQRLRAVARYSDGREVDVTSLAKFQTNNDGLANVDETGLVRIADVPGQVAVMASFAGQVDVFTVLIPQNEKLPTPNPTNAPNFIDRLVNAKLNRLNIGISPKCDDAEFLRRVTLDVIGTLPTADEAREFLADQSADKRERWVASLVDRPEFADYWALKWSDLLRVERQSLGHKAARDYYEWIRTSFATNKPLDRFARELLTADGPFSERPEGAFYRVVKTPGERAGTVSQVFLGVRIACAECHHHPYDRWSQTDYQGMSAFFMQVSGKTSAGGEAMMVAGDPVAKHPRTGETIAAYPLGEAMPEASPNGDRRIALAAWLTSGNNPWFARNLANRAWAHFLGRGLVEPIDDVRATNPPSNPDLMEALAKSLVDSGFDFRQLVRTITSSDAYQRSSTPVASNERDEQNYSRALFKRMDAEVLLDAVCQTTGVSEKFPGVPAGSRAVQLWDSRVSHYFLKLFGRPIRTTACSCERSVDANVGQVLHLLNSPELQAKLEHRGGRLARLIESHSQTNALVDELYLTFLTRYPTADEKKAAAVYLDRDPAQRRQAVQDLAWSLMNTLEFSFNH